MTYLPHIRLQAGGRFFDTEQWSMTLNTRIGSATLPPASDIALDQWEAFTRDNVADVASDVAQYVEDPGAFFSEAARLDYVKFNVIGPDGRYRNESETVAFYYEPADAPRGVTAPGPAQIALVISTITDAARGRASRGRWYSPIGSAGVDPNTGRVSSAITTSAAGAAAAFLSRINNQAGVDLNNLRAVVASGLGTPGPMRDITSVAVGNVLDTQRRRRGSLPEAYVTAPVTI